MVNAMKVHGTDVSHHQGALDLAKAKATGLEWLYHKATEGTSVVDPEYAGRRADALRAKVPFGAYHFARADRGDARQEARFFLHHAKVNTAIDLKPALDLETDEGMSLSEIRTWARQFVNECCRILDIDGMVVYTPYDLDEITRVGGKHIVWRPRYNDSNTPPSLAWDIWQFSNGVYGVPDSHPGLGHVDLNTHRAGFKTQSLFMKPTVTAPAGTSFTISHASQQWRDSDAQTREDIQAALDGSHVVTFTEVYAGSANLRILKDVAERKGYRVHHEEGETAIAVLASVPIKEKSHVLVNPGEKGKPPHDGHSKRVAHWVILDFEGETIFVVTGHWVTGFHRDPERRTKHERMSNVIRGLVQTHGQGSNLAFFTGDINTPDSERPTPGMKILDDGDLITCWDESGQHPPTHGKGDPIDLIGSYDRDIRVSLADSPRTFRQNSDHRRIRATYRIKQRRRS